MLDKPRKVKYQSCNRLRLKRVNRVSFSGIAPTFGFCAIQATQSGVLDFAQLESARKALLRKVTRDTKIFFKIFPDLALSARTKDSRMGKGKGKVSKWICPVQAGKIIVEIKAKPSVEVLEAMKYASSKLAVQTTIVTNTY